VTTPVPVKAMAMAMTSALAPVAIRTPIAFVRRIARSAPARAT
jgi:hypothetical protein